MTRVLVVEDSGTQALEIQILLEEAGYAVDLAINGRVALDAMAKSLPDIVLTDLEMPEMNGLRLVEAVRRKFTSVPVILMTALGSEEIAVEALQAGAASYVPKKNLHLDILPTLGNVLTVAHAAQQETRVLECLTQAEFSFFLENDVSLVGPLIGYLEESALRALHWDRTDMMRVGMALHEALLNAIQHGNLEVSSDLRQSDAERPFMELLEARRRQAPYSDRHVGVRVRLSPTEAVYEVADEGRGFDPTTLPDPADPINLERIGGRGLMLIRTFMDEVHHNEQGNQITMTKRCRPSQP